MLENIKLDEKYTLLIETTLGIIVSRKVKITKADMRDYAQYRNALNLNYIPKGKRSKVGFVFLPEQRFAIIEGWKDIKETFQDSNINAFECFDSKSFDNILESNKLEPIYIQ